MQDFVFEVELKRVREDARAYVVRGIASSTSVDSHETIFSEECQRGFMEDIKNNPENSKVSLEMEHMGDSMFFNMGSIIDAQIVRNNDVTNLIVEAEIEKSHPFSSWLMNKLHKKEINIGLSIRGNVERSHFENTDDGNVIRVFDRVKLKKIGITQNPSNKDTYLEVLSRCADASIDESKNNLREVSGNNEVFLSSLLPEPLIKTFEELRDNNMAKSKEKIDEPVTEVAEVDTAIVEEVTEDVAEIAEVKVEDKEVEPTDTLLEKVEAMFNGVKEFISEEFKGLRELELTRTELLQGLSDKITKLEEEVNRTSVVIEPVELVETEILPNEEVEELKRSVATLKEDLAKISTSPATKPAGQHFVIPDVTKIESKEDLDEMLSKGEISRSTYDNVIWKSFLNKNKLKRLNAEE